jgi:hypothetical protein
MHVEQVMLRSGPHTLSRAIDRQLGGHDSDVPTLACSP